MVQALTLPTRQTAFTETHKALLLSAVAIGTGASTEIDRPTSEKQSGYTLDYNTPYFQMFFIVKFLYSCHVNVSLENLPFIQS